MPESIGIFGGTFDPPHIGHLILAAEALTQLRLHRLLWVLTPTPPHKPGKPISPLNQRLDMLQLLLKDTPGFELCTVEMERPGPHYMLDTIHILQGQHPHAQLWLLIGGDSLRDLPAWHRPHELIRAVHAFGVMDRPGAVHDLDALETQLPGLRQKVHLLQTPQIEISSSSIRERIKTNSHFQYFLTPAVYDYIQKNRLYK